ncbi:MAG TPA: triphosphoribosyl-dephospho-CoA synthase [Planctomycetaceae bacterium]|nr:triphosphoribosyl-dephospho-CoA synthase [Planctomycetaceae bacterium]
MAAQLSLEAAVRRACLLESTAGKPGNVHPAAAFQDLSYGDFVRSAEAVAPVLARTAELGVGRAVYDAIRRTRETAGRNTNLGIVLLLAPLAAVPRHRDLRSGIGDVLAGLTQADASLVYRAIRLAAAGGMGRVDEQDIAAEPAVTLVEAMRLAAGRDTIAAEYSNGFQLVLGFGLPILAQRADFPQNWEQALIDLHLRLMVRQPDTLIARKCGLATARESSRRAAAVLEAGWPRTRSGTRELEGFDRWLRSDGNRRNPGTTADLVTACLFAALRDGLIIPPAHVAAGGPPAATAVYESSDLSGSPHSERDPGFDTQRVQTAAGGPPAATE